MERYDLLIIGGGAAGINALSHGERLIKSFGPDLLEVCEVE
jgi:pyruvate/2-oxoglutarate dehydrogenase complex dihydrolipoamide dehydrogenase (E3) component